MSKLFADENGADGASKRGGNEKAAGNIQRPAGLKIACSIKLNLPPRSSQTCIGAPRARFKYAVPSEEQRSCCGADTMGSEG
jgi:hypothetical protein